jgi:hypothetical protein
MHKRLIWFLATALLVGVLASCQTKAPETVVSQPTPEPATATTVVEPTATPVPATATAEPTATPVPSTPTATVAAAGPPDATAPKASPTPVRPWQIPTLHAGDWGKGNPEAGLVLVVYSDFQ